MRRGLLLLAIVAVAVAPACSKDKASRDHGVITKAGSVSVFDLRPGDCLKPDDDLSGDVEKINAVPCADPHTHEVFGVPEYKDDEGVYPGEAKIKEFADASCLEAFSEYTGTDYLDSDLFFSYLLPTIDSWNSGDDRQVTCVIVATGNEMTGSVKGTTTTTAKGSKSTTTSTTVKKTTTSTTATTAAP